MHRVKCPSLKETGLKTKEKKVKGLTAGAHDANTCNQCPQDKKEFPVLKIKRRYCSV